MIGAAGGFTSDLSIDEVLLLHTIGWEPVELVCGASVFSIPQGSWSGMWAAGAGEIAAASRAHGMAVSEAVGLLERECAQVGGHGVIGVEADFAVHRHHVDAVLVGTAVRPTGGGGPVATPWASDLSARDFILLHNSGWQPRGLAFGASFVYVPRRSLAQTMAQKGQNAELTNFTAAFYAAREAAMERMQASASRMGATGVVAAHVGEGPMPFAGHVVAFTAWGTGVVAGPGGHRHIAPQVVLPLDDPAAQFTAAALRGS
ncbi:MAG TPA: heavy metal-binding domain-containing protein [Acidimicrobiales bacterium]|nr:heavy metal-binding domain-containing protein [Acidimicrobiales bacterium]